MQRGAEARERASGTGVGLRGKKGGHLRACSLVARLSGGEVTVATLGEGELADVFWAMRGWIS